jgi:serine/threonine protein kinase
VPLSPGATFERYEIEGLVGRGGMGEVYRAMDSRLHRRVALKVLRTDKETVEAPAGGSIARLFREARAAAALNHANSVGIYELGEAEGIPYIAMEYVKGQPLRRFCGPGPVSIDTKVGWLADVAAALWAAHKRGIIHRDIKPSNIMVSEEGVVKVLDFGLAKPLMRIDPSCQTLAGQVLGTPRYMAPEQLEGAPPDARADQFAFGVTAYELIAGKYPGGPLAGSPDPLDSIIPGVPSALAGAIARMMARKPDDRFPTMDDASHTLRACIVGVIDEPNHRKTEAWRNCPSDMPTQAAPLSEVSVEVDLDIPISNGGATLPLPRPPVRAADFPPRATASTAPLLRRPVLPHANSAGVAASAAAAVSELTPSAASGPRPASGVSAPTPATPSIVSGVYLSGRPSVAASHAVVEEIVAPRPVTVAPVRRRWRVWILLVVVVLLAIACGAVAALVTPLRLH